MKRTISVIHEGSTTEIQWGAREPADGVIHGYVLIHEDGTLTVPFRDKDDTPYVFVLGPERRAVVLSEDQPPGRDDEAVWEA